MHSKSIVASIGNHGDSLEQSTPTTSTTNHASTFFVVIADVGKIRLKSFLNERFASFEYLHHHLITSRRNFELFARKRGAW